MELKDKTLQRKQIFNPDGEIALSKRTMIDGSTTNIHDYNNVKYPWTMEMFDVMMANHWIAEEINMSKDVKQYRELDEYELKAYNRVLSFLIFLDSIQTVNLPNIMDYITANEVNACLAVQTFQEANHSQAYSYILDSVAQPQERTNILYLWKDDEHLLKRNTFIGDIYNDFMNSPTRHNLMRVIMGNYILEGIYFYSGFSFFYALARMGKMPGTAQEIAYIQRDEQTHLVIFQNIVNELRRENPELFTPELEAEYKEMLLEGVRQEIAWGKYAIGNDIQGLNETMLENYIQYLGNIRAKAIGLGYLFEENRTIPESMTWVDEYANVNGIKTDFFEGKVRAYAKGAVIEDDL